MLREWLARFLDWLRRDQLDRELTDELGFHRAQLETAATAEGADAEEARYAARRQLGNLIQHREAVRDRWSWPWLDHLQQDVRYAFRGLRRSPGFTAAVVLTLGLGIGANAAMFGVIDRLMFRPFAFLQSPSRVHRIYLQWQDRGRERFDSYTEYTRFLDFKKGTTSFDRIAGFSTTEMAVGVGDAARVHRIGVVSAEFFDFFDAPPALGRYFGPSEDTTPRGAPVIVLSYAYWQSEYGGENVLGRTLLIRNVLCTIIGVAPEGFTGVAEQEPPVGFIPITTYAGSSPSQRDAASYYTRYNWGWMSVMVRRAPGVSLEQASRDLSNTYLKSWNAELALDVGGTPAEIARPAAIPGPLKTAAGPGAGVESKTLLWVSGVAVIVLLIACANVANLMFARVLRRRRETAVRLALGVSQGRLVAQSLTESLLLAGLGSVAGVLIAQWGGAVLRQLFLPAGSSMQVWSDWRTLAVAGGFALVAGVLTGLGPAFLAIRHDLATTLKSGAREGTFHKSRTRTGLLILQGALSVILLVGAGLFVRSLNNVRSMPLGYDPNRLLMVTVNMRGMQLDDSATVLLGRRLLETGRAIPEVEHAAWVSSIPFWSTSSTSLFVTGIDSVRRLGRFTYQTATGDYFPAMGTRILRGRPFTDADQRGTPRVAVVSEGMARVLWAGQEALGKCMRVSADTMPCTSVIGIAEDAVQNSLVDDQRFRYYLPMDQHEPTGGFALALRMRGERASASVEAVRGVLQKVMPGQAYVTVQVFEELVDGQRRAWKVGATMFVAFGALALLVAAVGLYGVITYNVAQRMHELGVRIALGAQSSDVIRLVVGQGVRFAILGVATGLAAALLLARWMQPLLFQQSAKDPVVYGTVAGLLLLVASLASALPAHRATKADPNTALRSD